MVELETTYRLTSNDFDKNDNLLPTTILNLFQDIAGEHANSLNIGYEILKKKNIMWIIIRSKFTLLKNPSFYDTIKIKTWPLPLGKIEAQREYEIYLHNELIGYGTSLWILCDYQTRHIMRMKDISYGEDKCNEKEVYQEKITKLSSLDFYSHQVKIKPSYLDLDHNNHVNNTKYLSLMINNIPLLHNKIIKEVQIEYLKEISVNDEITLSYYSDNKKIYAKGSLDNNINFLAEITTN